MRRDASAVKEIRQNYKKRTFFDSVSDCLFPENDPVIIMANIRLQVTVNSASTCPNAYVTRSVALKRGL